MTKMCPFLIRECPEDDTKCVVWGTGCSLGAGGDTYSKTMTMTDDNATRFETSKKTLRDIVILVETNAMLLGQTGTEVYTVGVDETVGFTKIDISTLYFKNAGAGLNGKITILGVAD